MTLRDLVEWAISGRYDLDKKVVIEVEWTDYTAEELPKEGLLYMPIKSIKQYIWGVALILGEREELE